MNSVPENNLYHSEFNSILHFSTLINSSLKIESVLDNAMKCAEKALKVEASTIYEMDEESNELFVRLARGEKSDPYKKIRLKIGEGIAGKVFQSGQARLINDMKEAPDFNDIYDRLTGFKTSSLICVPLVIKDKTIGALQVLNKKNGEPFSDSDLEILTSLSHQIAIAIDNANLYCRLEQQFELTAQELKTTQEKLIRSERLAAMGNLIDGVAHEIRNPIMVIGGFARRIREHSKSNRILVKYADIIVEESERLEILVKKVRKFADIQTAVLKPDHIGPALNEVLKCFDSLLEASGIKITLNIEPDLPSVEIDRPQIMLALSNIIENSIEAINEKGKITVNVKKKKNYVVIEIKDTGSGIEKDRINSIYDPFVTSKARGDGLGLTMVNQILTNHKGDIKISSSKGRGTTAQIRVPLSKSSV